MHTKDPKRKDEEECMSPRNIGKESCLLAKQPFKRAAYLPAGRDLEDRTPKEII
jgi:hypothetical protein